MLLNLDARYGRSPRDQDANTVAHRPHQEGNARPAFGRRGSDITLAICHTSQTVLNAPAHGPRLCRNMKDAAISAGESMLGRGGERISPTTTGIVIVC